MKYIFRKVFLKGKTRPSMFPLAILMLAKRTWWVELLQAECAGQGSSMGDIMDFSISSTHSIAGWRHPRTATVAGQYRREANRE